MNRILFALGLSLFVFAAIYAASSHEKTFSLCFGGLGVATFVSLFFLRPMDQLQNALSNLVQVEISIMNFCKQSVLWENYALVPQGIPNPANIERASEMLQRFAKETIDVLQKYVEIYPPPSSNN